MASVFAGSSCLAAPAGGGAAVRVQSQAQAYAFAFQDATISQAAQEVLGSALGLAYTLDPEVTGKITLRIDQRLTRAQLFEAFEAALEANGVTMVRTGDSVIVEPIAKAKTAVGIRAPGEAAAAVGYSVVAVPLSYAIPSEVAKALAVMGRKELVLYTDDKLGLIVLGGTAKEIAVAEDTLRVLDQSGLQATRVRWFELNQALARDVGQELQQIIKAAGASGLTVLPLPRLNGVLVFARTGRSLDEATAWIQKLDVPSKEERQTLWIYRPTNLSADSLAGTLRSVFGGGGGSDSSTESKSSSAGPAGAARPGGPSSASESVEASDSHGSPGQGSVRVGVNKDSNVLIVTALPSEWIQIQRVLEQTDRPPGQVLIEASILEVTLSDEFRFGVDWQVVSGSTLTATFADNKAGSLAQVFPGLSVNYLSKSITATVNALKAKTDVEVVSAPKLVVLDNHSAKLQVGDQVPITTQSAQSTTAAGAPLVSNTDYRDTGVIMTVTPRISGEDQVVIDIDQQVSAVAQTTTSDINSPTIQQRRLQSTLLLKDGGTVALGGLISTGRTKGRSAVPFVSRIPGLGVAFKSTDDQTHRTEMIVLLTAKIAHDAGESEHLLDKLSADMKDIGARGLLKP